MLKAIFVDIDDTITHIKDNPYHKEAEIGENYFEGIARDLLIDRFNFLPSDALRQIREAEELCGRHDPFFALTNCNLGIKETELWDKIIKWQEKYLLVFPDAVYMIKELYKRKFNLYIISNNGTMGIWAKLTRAKLATQKGTKYFKKLYGDDVYTGKSKGDPAIYKEILERENLDPSKVVMIGDNIEQDGKSPLKAGIKKIVIVDRNQKEPIIDRDEFFFVKSLRIVPEILG